MQTLLKVNSENLDRRTLYWAPNITKDEIHDHTNKPRIKNFINTMVKVSTVPTFGRFAWFCVSIDYSWDTLLPRSQTKADTKHTNREASDWIPVDYDLMLKKQFKAHIVKPLNRNLALALAFKSAAKELRLNRSDLPFIAFEADHIHVDVKEDGGIYLYNETRAAHDSLTAHAVTMIPSLNDRTCIKIF